MNAGAASAVVVAAIGIRRLGGAVNVDL